MFRKILAITAMLFAITSFAAVDANKGSASELDELKGVGPAMSQRIVDARKQGEFKNWDDFMARVKGVKAKKAAKLSADGLTINGQPFKEVAATGKVAAATPTKAAPAAPAASAAPAKSAPATPAVAAAPAKPAK